MTSTTSSGAWLRRFRPTTRPRLRLLCLPHAGGTPAVFHALARCVPSDVDLLAVCYPGRHHRFGEPCAHRMDDLVDPLCDEVAALADVPLALFGHSMGALVGYELTRRHPDPVATLVVSAHVPPHLVTGPVVEDHDERVLSDLCTAGVVDQRLLDDPELRALVMPSLRADHAVLNHYRPADTPAVPVPIVAYHGADDPLADRADVTRWAELTTGAFRRRAFPGGHFYLETAAADIAADLVGGNAP